MTTNAGPEAEELRSGSGNRKRSVWQTPKEWLSNPLNFAVLSLAAMLLCFAYLSLSPGPIAQALSAGDPVKATLMMTIVLDWALITLLLVQPNAVGPRQVSVWRAALVAMLLLALVEVTFVSVAAFLEGKVRWGVTLDDLIQRKTGPILIVLIPSSLLLIMNVVPTLARPLKQLALPITPEPDNSTDANGTGANSTDASGSPNDTSNGVVSASDLQRWGKIAAVIVMLLAIFAFGLTYDETKGLVVNWEELPAIVLVFVIAELGITLVALSIDVGKRVENTNKAISSTTDAAKLAHKDLQERIVTFSEVETQTETTLKKLEPAIKDLTILTNTDLWITASDSAKKLALYDGGKGRELPLFEALDRFTKAWLPSSDVALTAGAPGLLGKLFEAYIGSDQVPGTVRKEAGVISCVAADDIFAEVSEHWLISMQEFARKRGSELAVWATTALLPTEFAFPAAYRGATTQPTERARSFEKFTQSVIRACSAGVGVSEYRRVTVLHESEFKELLKGPEEVAHDFTLQNWFILDPTVSVSEFGSAYTPAELLSVTLALTGSHVTGGPLTAAELKRVFSNQDLVDGGRMHTFPFRSRFPEQTHDFLLRHDQNQLHVIAGNSEHWEKQPGEETLLQSGILAVQRDAFRDHNLGQIVELLGWKSLLDWYVFGMHKAPDDCSTAAWWSVVKNKHAELFNPLRIGWGGTRVFTHDLLLLGTKAEPGQRPDWHGAAISNLSSDRTECTIQLILDAGKLAEIDGVVASLCGDFGKRDSPESGGPVERFGRWTDWPGSVRKRL